MKSIGNKINLIIAVIGFVFLSILAVSNIRSISQQIQSQNREHRESKIIDFSQQVTIYSETSLWIATIAAEMKNVKKAYQNYYKTNDLVESTKIIENEFKNINKGIKENLKLSDVPKIHFHLPPAKSFIRCWTDKRGDDISKFRSTVLQISENNKPISGFEIGRGGLELRGLAPIFDTTKTYLGSVEVLFTLDQVIGHLDIEKDENFSILMDTSFLKIASDFLSKDASNVKSDNDKVGKWIYVTQVNSNFQRNLIHSNDLNFQNLDTITFEKDNYEFICFPIKDYSGKQIALGIFQKDISMLNEIIRNVILYNVLISLFLITTFILVIVYISKIQISRPLNNSLERIIKMEKGVLLPEATNDKKDEISTLNQYVEKMKKQILILIKGVKDISSKILENSKEFKSISESVASGSSQLASTSEQLAATIEQMSASIMQNKENAITAENLVMTNKSVIEEGVSTMQKTLNAFETIVSKVQIIKEIASKIDLLSINASIESAKAGEHGKGFKVIAEEIRKLSDYSNSASIKITEITVSNMDLAKKTSTVLNGILPSFQSIVEKIQEITQSSIEQNTASEQINNSVNQFVDVSLNNANLSEMMINLTDKLLQYSNNLDVQLNMFIIDEKSKNNHANELLNKVKESINNYNLFVQPKEENNENNITIPSLNTGAKIVIENNYTSLAESENIDKNFEKF